MRWRSGPVVSHRRRSVTRGRPRSVIRRYLPCLRQSAGGSDTDSELDSQLSSLLDHQHHPIVECLPIPEQSDRTPANSQTTTAVIVELASSSHESPTLDRRHAEISDSRHQIFGGVVGNLQLPLFRGRPQRWHTSFGQYDNLTSMAAADASSATVPDSDDILTGSIFVTLFDSGTPGVIQPRTVGAIQQGGIADDCTTSQVTSTNVASHRHSFLTSRSDVTEPVASPNIQTLTDVNATSDYRSHSGTASSTSGSTSSSQHTVHYYYDHRLRPGGVLSAARVARIWNSFCPPAYDDIVTAAADIFIAAGSAACCDDRPPPPPYVSLVDEPPAYSDIVDGAEHVVRRTSVTGLDERTSPTSTCAPFNGRLAVRWNRNMRVERWTSSASWITSY